MRRIRIEMRERKLVDALESGFEVERLVDIRPML